MSNKGLSFDEYIHNHNENSNNYSRYSNKELKKHISCHEKSSNNYGLQSNNEVICPCGKTCGGIKGLTTHLETRGKENFSCPGCGKCCNNHCDLLHNAATIVRQKKIK